MPDDLTKGDDSIGVPLPSSESVLPQTPDKPEVTPVDLPPLPEPPPIPQTKPDDVFPPPPSVEPNPPGGKDDKVVSTGSKNSSKTKAFLMVVVFFLVAAASVSGYYLFQKGGMGIQKKAYTLGGFACKRWSGGWPAGYKSPSSSTAGKINFFMAGGGDGGEEVVAVCDYQKALKKAGGNISKIKCDQGDDGVIFTDYRANMTAGRTPSNAGYTRGLSDFVQANHYGGKCQVIQVDLTGCNRSGTYDGQSYPSWDGGVAFVIAYNDECPAPSTCRIQGYKVMMPGNVNTPPASTQTITCVGPGGTYNTAVQPYIFDVTPGNYTCTSTVPSGHTVGSTLCIGIGNYGCHNDPPVTGASRAFNCPGGQEADLWWHYYAIPTKPPLVTSTPKPTAVPTKVPTAVPTKVPTAVPAACSSFIIDNVTTGEKNVSSVKITDKIKFTINFTTTTNVDAVAIRIIENGQIVATMIDERANNNAGQMVGTWEASKWFMETSLPTQVQGSGQAQLEFKAYIKTNGVWR